jgi:hypothetical protein
MLGTYKSLYIPSLKEIYTHTRMAYNNNRCLDSHDKCYVVALRVNEHVKISVSANLSVGYALHAEHIVFILK